MWARWSERSRIATSFASSTVASGSLWNRWASSSAGLAGPAVERKALGSLAGNEAVEVRKPPRDRHAEPGGRRGVVGVELREDVLERPLRVGEVGRGEVELGRHHLVVERRHEHLDVVLVHDLDPLEEMLLGQLRAGRDRSLRRRGRRGGRRARRRPPARAPRLLRPRSAPSGSGSRRVGRRDQHERGELLLEIRDDFLVVERRRQVLRQGVEPVVVVPEQQQVPRVGVLVDGVELRLDPVGRDRAVGAGEAGLQDVCPSAP